MNMNFNSYFAHWDILQRWNKAHRQATVQLEKELSSAHQNTCAQLQQEFPLQTTSNAGEQKEVQMPLAHANEEVLQEYENEEDQEMDEKMIEFFRQTLRHRQEREAKKAAEKEARKNNAEIEYVDDVKIGYDSIENGKTRVFTSEELGNRTDIVNELAAKMDAEFQATYHSSKKPELWPSIPLNLKFFTL